MVTKNSVFLVKHAFNRIFFKVNAKLQAKIDHFCDLIKPMVLEPVLEQRFNLNSEMIHSIDHSHW